ncbi:MAG TPA: hypothetical protein VMF03_01485 [Steroidobacteraceae bacterium]|nr:hypothetical protein [Steroidobacteraceae bacterium]
MLVTVWASWYVGSSRRWRRKWGFWLFLCSNLMWSLWGVWAHAYGLIVLQLFLAVTNVRGLLKCEPDAAL